MSLKLIKSKKIHQNNYTMIKEPLTLFWAGMYKFAHPYLDVTKREFWGPVGALNLFTYNIIILDIFCENLVCVGPPLQIL